MSTETKKRAGKGIEWAACFGIFLGAFLPLDAATVNVFAAASLTDSLKELASTYEQQFPDKIAFSFGASSTLARQIEEGAPADIFFSADEAKMDALEKKGLLDSTTRRSRLSNTLVIVVPLEQAASVRSPKDLASRAIRRIALGDPRAVPIGVYARQYLEKLDLWKPIQPKVVPTENVRAALAAVESGDVDASIVYKTDAIIAKKLKVVFEVPPEDCPNISYPMAMIKDAKEPEAGKRFLHYLDSKEAGQIFEKHGFILQAKKNAR